MLELTLALIVFLFPLAYSPGPGNMFFAATGARFGFAATVPANAGYHVATWLVTALMGFGFAAVAQSAPGLFIAIKWAGSAYVLFLAWKLFGAGASDRQADAKPAGFASGALLLVLNPKAYVIIALMFSQFLTGTGLSSTVAILWLSTVFTLNNLIAFFVWITVGDTLARRFRDPAHAHHLNRLFGAILGLVAVWMMLS